MRELYIPMDFLLLGSIFALFGYPFVAGALAFWLSKRAVASNALTLQSYLKQGVLTALVPPMLLILFLALLGLSDYKGFCSGWMDSGSKACSLGEYFQLQLFWGVMLAFVPSLVGIGLTIIFFLWHWARHKQAPTKSISDVTS